MRNIRRWRAGAVMLLMVLWSGTLWPAGGGSVRSVGAQGDGSNRVLLPLVTGGNVPDGPPPLDCAIPGASYDAISVENWRPPERPAAAHADINLALRGYAPTGAALTLVDYNGDRHPAPQLYGLFVDSRTPRFTAAYRVYQWDWECNCRKETFEGPYPVSALGMQSTRGEPIYVPDREAGHISSAGHKVLVLYAEEHRVTLKYTREDSVVHGYTIHLENICVDPNLLRLYRALNEQGRHSLPALHARQPLGYANGDELTVAIRDTGMWMDPRSRKDWWFGR